MHGSVDFKWPKFPKQARPAPHQPVLVSPDTARVIAALQRGQRSQIMPMPPPRSRTIKFSH
jgi:hypothetical protein